MARVRISIVAPEPAGGAVVGGLSYDVFPPSMTSIVGLPSAEKNRNSWAPKGSGCHPAAWSATVSTRTLVGSSETD